MLDGFDPMIPGQPLFAQFRISGNKIEGKEAVENKPNSKTVRTCRFTSNFEFRYLNSPIDLTPDESEEARKHLIVEIFACITIDYLLTTSKMPSQDKLEQWASGNALLHSWPYWREFCHSTLSRMNLPVTMLPLMEINPEKE